MKKFLENIKAYNMLEKGDRVVVGVSGGPDSIYLLEMLNLVKDDLGLQLIVAHVNHGIRGEAADADEEFVKKKAEKLSLQYEVIRVNMNEYAKEHKMSSEDAGRLLRYGFFHKLAGDNGKIAVAHNRDDQAETLLMRVIRGTGVDGLAAMRFCKGQVIRPILSISRNEIESYLEENNIEFVTDLTNLECDYFRNKVRLKTIPEIEREYNPAFMDNLYKLSMIAGEETDYMEEMACKTYERLVNSADGSIDINGLLKEHKAIITRVIRIGISKVNNSLKEIGHVHVDAILSLMEGQSGKSLDLPQGILVKKSFNKLLFLNASNLETKKESFKLEIGENSTDFGKFFLENNVKDISYGKNKINIDYSKIKGRLYVRGRNNGDYFKPLGMKGRKKLKDFFIDEKIPLEERDNIPLLCDEENIIWVCGKRLSEDYKIEEKTEDILTIKWENKI